LNILPYNKIACPGNKILPPFVEGRFCFRTYPPWTQKNFHLGFTTWTTAVWWPRLWATECWRNSARGMPIWCIGGRATQTTCTLSLNFTATAHNCCSSNFHFLFNMHTKSEDRAYPKC
jgi:hypothetical protein